MAGPASYSNKNGKRWGRKLTVLVPLVLAGVVLVYYWASLASLNQSLTQPRTHGPVQLRPLPFPFRAAVALTLRPGPETSLDDFVQALRYLNSTQQTPLGLGLGLEAGGSFIFYPPAPGWATYFNPPGPAGLEVRQVFNSLIRAGVLDVLESYGQDVHFKREMAEQALAALADQGLSLNTWADRFESLDNLALSGGRGAHPGRMAYHLDLTTKAGFKFFWLGQTTCLIGQDVPVDWQTFLSLYRASEPLSSYADIVLAFGRHLAAMLTASSNDVKRNNRLMSPVTFKDGSRGYEYIRFEPSGRKQDLASALSRDKLDRLVDVGGKAMVSVVYKPGPFGRIFLKQDEKALRELAQRRRQGQIMVTTASRLLTYSAAFENLKWTTERRGDEVVIRIKEIDDFPTGPRSPNLAELAGMTFYVPQASKTRLFCGDKELELKRNLIDRTGRESVSLPWSGLQCPQPSLPDNS
ncbi:MAG: hypothetical protein JRJ59_10815, partial [Deltaproteobacteria bacterium]|nr:hypothetical protein [Deltaproteobacteria bacterium]